MKTVPMLTLLIPFFLPLLLSISGETHASETCAATIGELAAMLGEQTFPLEWEETTMDDGKPLVVSFGEHKGALFMEFTKTGEGLWAESHCVVCKTGTAYEARFSGNQIRLGPAANLIQRYALRNGGKFTLTKLGADQLRITTSSWSGIFSPTPK
jgi:hypothetical protein